MAEQVLTSEHDSHSDWLDMAKQKIKKEQRANALQRIDELKHLIVKSVKDTLAELKLQKYDGNVTFFNLSGDEVEEKLRNEWNVSKLNEWEAPTINDRNGVQSNEYLTLCSKQYADRYGHQCDLTSNPIFWEFILKESWIYCEAVASDIFDNSSDIQLSNTLNKCLGVCGLLDILKAKMPKHTLIDHMNLQNIINQQFGTKLDVEKWKKTEDIKKVYKQCALSIQKEAMKAGKAFVKLYKVYKIQRRKEKKRKANQPKKQIETETKPTVIPTAIKEEKAKTENKVASSNTNLFVFASIIALCVVILAVVRKWN